MNNKGAPSPPLRIRPEPSPRLAGFLLLTHGAALAVVWALPLRWYLQVGLAAAVLTVLAYEVAAKVLFRVSWQVREATWGADRTWTLELQDGTRIEAQLLPSSFVSQGLVVLNFRCGRWRICNLVLLRDALDADILRRLRVRLRLWGAADGQGRDALP